MIGDGCSDRLAAGSCPDLVLRTFQSSHVHLYLGEVEELISALADSGGRNRKRGTICWTRRGCLARCGAGLSNRASWLPTSPSRKMLRGRCRGERRSGPGGDRSLWSRKAERARLGAPGRHPRRGCSGAQRLGVRLAKDQARLLTARTYGTRGRATWTCLFRSSGPAGYSSMTRATAKHTVWAA